MIERCENPKNKKFPSYGGRGIRVCSRWRNSFEAFLEDMGGKPKGFSVDRIDNNGNYEPGNCRWADAKTQAKNRRSNVWIEYKGKRMIISDWADALGINRGTLEARKKAGWADQEIIERPVEYQVTTPLVRPYP